MARRRIKNIRVGSCSVFDPQGLGVGRVRRDHEGANEAFQWHLPHDTQERCAQHSGGADSLVATHRRLLMRRRCNTRIITETAAACAPCSPLARADLVAARVAAKNGNCALMHRYAQSARSLLQLHGR